MDFADKFRRNIGAPRSYRIGHGEDAQDFVFKPIPASYFGDQMMLQKSLSRAFAGASKLNSLYDENSSPLAFKPGVTEEQIREAMQQASDSDLDAVEYANALKLLFAMVRNSYPKSEHPTISDQDVEMFCTANFQQLLMAFLDLNTNIKYAAEDLSKIKAMKQKVNQGESQQA